MGVYRPSYVANIESDLVVEKVSNSCEAERKLNGDYPITAITEKFFDMSSINFSDTPYLKIKSLPDAVRSNPDKYLLPLDIVHRGVHFGVYLGEFCDPSSKNFNIGSNSGSALLLSSLFASSSLSSSSSPFSLFASASASSSSSSVLGSNDKKVIRFHPKVPFKKKDIIIRHIAKAISYDSAQTSSINILFRVTYNSCLSLTEQIEMTNRILDDLTSSYSYEKGRIERYIQESESNRNYTCSKYRIEQEKFQERIIVYPKD
ncbi:2128_t:CDS:2 [Funneliformis geosporum]|uniref:2128_t:CDS:1 n=1 Tax=Funneliformis geosporum TaxID=1117311 RepID=A0A9W4X8B2_9GLOM|nr:2128_t:CDS:2 [Funneliformis geosporum]